MDEGKVKFLGLSEVAPADVRRAHAIHPIALVEMCVPDLNLNHLCICTVEWQQQAVFSNRC